MNKKIVIGNIGAVVIVLLLVSSATAINTTQTKNVNEAVDDEIYVDSDIHLTRVHLAQLKESYENLKNSEYSECKEVLHQIITSIEENGEVNSNNIRNIIGNSNIQATAIHGPGSIDAHSNGAAYTIPFLRFRTLIGLLVCVGGILGWDAYNDGCMPGTEHIEVTVGDTTYTNEHEGLAIGVFGSGSFIVGAVGGYIWPSFYFHGTFVLAFVW